MKLGDVLKKEREQRNLLPGDAAERLHIPEGEYIELESGSSPAEEWAPFLAEIAISLETPSSRLLAPTGRFTDTQPGQAGSLIRAHREARGKTVEEMAAALKVPVEQYAAIESGESPLERYGPLMLGFAELVDQPVFNLFYPCGLPYRELEDYP
jgi:transcriptional regulator with XRE-family HTH domain